MTKSLYYSLCCCSIIFISAVFSTAFGWERTRYDVVGSRDTLQQQERRRAEQVKRRQKYRSIVDLTSILNLVAEKISNDALIGAFKSIKTLLGDEVTYQIIDSLSQPNVRESLLEAFFDEDTISDYTPIKLDDHFYARLFAAISLSQTVSQNTIQIFGAVMEQRLLDRFENIRRLKTQIIEQKMGYIPTEQLTPLVTIINKVAKNHVISKEFIASVFDNLKETFDYAFAYQLANTLVDQNIRSQILKESFSGGRPQDKTAVVINAQFYATLIDALYQDDNIEPVDTDVFVQIAKGILRQEWEKIDALRTQDMRQYEDAWGGAVNTAEIPTRELDNILRQRNVNTDKIKAQFIIDFMTTYMEVQTTETISVFGNLNTSQDARLDRLKTAFKTVKTAYISKLSDKRHARNIENVSFVKDFSELISKVEKMTMQIDGPRYTPWLFQTYLSRLTNQKFRAQVQNGARVDIKKAFADFAQSQTSGKPVKMNSDMLYLLCIQLIGVLETEILNGNSTTKVQDFINNTQALLQETLPPKLNNLPIVNGILQTILQTIPDKVQKPDANIVCGVGIFNMIKIFRLNDSIQKILVQRIQPMLDKMGISNQIVLKYQTDMVQHLQQLKTITANSTQKFDLLGASNQQNPSQSTLEKTIDAVDSVSKTPFGKMLNKLFG